MIAVMHVATTGIVVVDRAALRLRQAKSAVHIVLIRHRASHGRSVVFRIKCVPRGMMHELFCARHAHKSFHPR